MTAETLMRLAKRSRLASPKAHEDDLARLFVAYLIGYTRAMDGDADELARLVGMPHPCAFGGGREGDRIVSSPKL